MGIGNFGKFDSPETSVNSEFDSSNQFDSIDSDKLDTGIEVNTPERSDKSETDGSEKLDSGNVYSYKHPDEDERPKGVFSYKHPDEGERPKGVFSYKHPDEDERPKGVFSYKHPDEGKRPKGDFSYKPENNFSRESYEDEEPGGRSPYTLKRTR